MLIQRSEVVSLWNMLNGELLNVSGPIRFVHFLAKLKSTLRVEIEALHELAHQFSASPDYIEYDQKRQMICRKYAEIDDAGNFKEILDGGIKKYVFSNENDIIVSAEINKLLEEYNDVIIKHQESLNEVNKFYKDNLEIDLPILNIEYIPDNILNVKQLEYFMQLGLIAE